MASKEMSMEESLKSLHRAYYPMIRKLVEMAHDLFKPNVELHRKRGFRTKFNRKLDNALARFAKRFSEFPNEWRKIKNSNELAHLQNISGIILSYEPLVQAARDLALAGAEIEIALFPKWFSWLIEELEREGLIYYDAKKKRIKTLGAE